MLEEQRQARAEEQRTGQTETCAENVDRVVKMELEETDAKGTENGSVRESPESIPLKSMLEIEEFKLETTEELPETQAEDLSEQNELSVDSKDQDREKEAVDTPEKILSGAGHVLIVVDSDSDDDDCVLLEDTIDEFPKPQTNIQTDELEQNSLPPSILLNKIQKYNLSLVLVSACAVHNKKKLLSLFSLFRKVNKSDVISSIFKIDFRFNF